MLNLEWHHWKCYLFNMEEKALDCLVKLFHTVYYLIQAAQLSRDFVGLWSLQERNGVNTGKSYRNDKQAATVTHYSAETVKKDFANKLYLADQNVSVLNDSSTDISVTDDASWSKHLIIKTLLNTVY